MLVPGRGSANRAWRLGGTLLGRVVNETRYPEGTVSQAEVRYVADRWDGGRFVPQPGQYGSLQLALHALLGRDE